MEGTCMGHAQFVTGVADAMIEAHVEAVSTILFEWY
jgi:hypothetical protein